MNEADGFTNKTTEVKDGFFKMDNTIGIESKFMWLETKIKRMNNPRLPNKVQANYNDLLDQVVNLKCIVLSELRNR